jgi:hypothetical protein
MGTSRPYRVLATLAILSSLVGCAQRQVRTLTPSENAHSLDKRSPYLKAHMRDGRVYVLSRWEVDEAAGRVTGTGVLLGLDRNMLESGPVTVPIGGVALFETNVVQKSPAVAALAVITGISAAVTGYCIANPKACFGSCPTFYVSSGERSVLQAEGFSDNIAPSLEARDVDALFRARPTGRRLDVRMRNEALETHVVRYVRLLAAPRPEHGRVLATQTGELWQAEELSEPRACAAVEGDDCLAAVRHLDGHERFSPADPEDLAARETIDLEFDPVGDGPLAVVVGSRQTLLSTFLFYPGLAYMGRSATGWLARLESGDRDLARRATALRRVLGGIDVLVRDGHDRWQRAGELYEAGPLAVDVKMVALPPLPPGPVRVRLVATRGNWRLDYVALARLGGRVDPIRLDPVEVRKGDRIVAVPPAGLTTLPGDEYEFAYRLPENPERYELFLDTRGYYLEWMRDEWLAEEDPARALLLFTDPNRALRLLASAFKQKEAGMEDVFWRSRYVQP